METNKKYYQISVSPEPKIIGVKNGVYQVEINHNSLNEDTKYNKFINWFDYKNKKFWSDQGNVKQLDDPCIKGKMLKNALLTDIMGYAPEYHGLHDIYSETYINIIKTFDLSEYSLFDFDIENVLEKYYLMFVKTIPTSEIIFSNSIIYTGHKMMNNLKYHPLNSYQNYRDFKEVLPLARFEKIAIPKNYYGKDILAIQPSSKLFYSEKLIDFLLDCGITGLQVSHNNSIQLEFV